MTRYNPFRRQPKPYDLGCSVCGEKILMDEVIVADERAALLGAHGDILCRYCMVWAYRTGLSKLKKWARRVASTLAVAFVLWHGIPYPDFDAYLDTRYDRTC